MSNYKLKKVTIDHFRGYRYSREFDLQNNDIAILSGSNGYGKTSFFDAIEWAFTGKLFRYETANEERNNTKFINFQPNEENAKVILEFGNEENQYFLTREAIYSENRATDYGRTKFTLETPDKGILKNARATEEMNNILVYDEWKSKIKFEEVFSQYHLLTQDKLKNFIQGLKAPERFTQLSVLFGTDKFGKYKDGFKNVHDDYFKKLEETNSSLEKINTKIGELEENIKHKESLGISNYDEKLINLIVAYNLELKGILTDVQGGSVSEKCINYKDQVLKEINSLKIKIPRIQSSKESLQSVYKEIPRYIDSKRNSEKLAVIQESGDEIQGLTFIKDNIEFYENYPTIKQKQVDDIHVGNQLLIRAKDYNSQIIVLEGLISGILNQTIGLHKSEFKGLASFLQNIEQIRTKLSEIPNLIQYELRNKSSFISIGTYELSIARKVSSYYVVTECLKLIDELKIKVNEFTSKLSNLTQRKSENQNVKNGIDSDLASLNILEINVRKILNDALIHITTNEKQEVNCPVCTSSFSKEELIGKIKSQLMQENPLIQEKLDKQQSLIKEINDIDSKLKDERERIQTTIKNFEATIGCILQDIKDLTQILVTGINDTELCVINLNKDLKKMDKQYETILDNIDKFKLDRSVNLLSKQIFEQISKYDKKISSLGYSFQSGDLDLITKQLNEYISQSELFEKELKQKKVNISLNLVDEVLKLVNEEEVKLTMLEERIKLLESLDKELLEINLAVIEDVNQKKLNELFLQRGKLKKEIDDYGKTIKNLKHLQAAVTNSISNINKTLFDENKQFVNAIFKRLNPHPYFRSVDFNVDANNHGNNTLSLNCVNQDKHSVNPAYIFSSAQINILALSIFLSVALRQRCTRLDIVLLDDPIQNMDDMNVVAFIDIVRSLFSDESMGKQVVLSTHDDQLYRLMMKKFRFFKTKAFEFIGYNELGPNFNMRDISIR